MDKLAKALAALLVLTISIISSSPKNGNIIEVIQNNPPQFFTEYTSNFYRQNKEIKEILDPVVKISFVIDVGSDKITIGSGTGFGIHYDRESNISYIITNAHICSMADDVPFAYKFYFEDRDTIIDQQVKVFSGELAPVVLDKNKDLCLMISDRYIRPARIANNYTVHQLDKVRIVGAPNGVYPIIIDSYISNVISRNIMGYDTGSTRPLLLISALVFGGQSGSPIYNEHNEVIGVAFMGLKNEDGTIYGGAGIPLEDIQEFIKDCDL